MGCGGSGFGGIGGGDGDVIGVLIEQMCARHHDHHGQACDEGNYERERSHYGAELQRENRGRRAARDSAKSKSDRSVFGKEVCEVKVNDFSSHERRMPWTQYLFPS